MPLQADKRRLDRSHIKLFRFSENINHLNRRCTKNVMRPIVWPIIGSSNEPILNSGYRLCISKVNKSVKGLDVTLLHPYGQTDRLLIVTCY